MDQKPMGNIDKNRQQTTWDSFIRSPLTIFAGIFSTLETVVLGFISYRENFNPVDGVILILMTVCMFVIIVLARPQALYPPSEWREPCQAPDARIALWAIIIFIFCVGGGWMMSKVAHEFMA